MFRSLASSHRNRLAVGLLILVLVTSGFGSASARPIQSGMAQAASGHQALKAAADLPIYVDALAGDWQDWSWDTTRDFNNADPVHSGSASIAVTYTAKWGGLLLHTDTALPVGDYTAIRFWVHGGSTGGQSVNFHVNDVDVNYPFTAQANTWLQVTVPLAVLGNPTVLSDLFWQDGSGNDLGQPTYYLDDISLIWTPPAIPDWGQVNLDGFGNPANGNVFSLEVFGGQLYAGASNWAQGGQVWRSTDGATWTAVSDPGFGSAYTTTNAGLLDMIEFNSQLYVSTGWGAGSAPGQIWRSPNGTDWTQVEGAGFGDPGNTAIATFAVFNSQLYAATQSSNGLEIWRSSTGDSGGWSRVMDNGKGNANNHTVTSLMEFNGSLYAAVENNTDGAEIWRTSNGTTWTTVKSGGFGSAGNIETGGLAIFGGNLYVGTHNDTTGGQIWRSNNGTNWTQVVGDGFGDLNNFKIESLMSLDGALYAGTDNSVTGIEMWRSSDGTAWTQVNLDGFGDSHNTGTLWSVGTVVFNEDLYIGTNNAADGGEVWTIVSPLHDFTAISTGEDHTCALTGDDGIQCWGNNTYGQLGDGTTTDRHMPVNVVGFASGVSNIAAGGRQSCLVTNTGGAKCWGQDGLGQLGDNYNCAINSPCLTPVDVYGMTSGVNSIVTGWAHGCVLTSTGGAACWGYNQSGQVGSGGSSTIFASPWAVSGLSNGVSSISAGYSHTCALIDGGGVKCWGNGGYGRLGNNSNSNSNTPVDVNMLASGVSAISAGGAHTCALTTGGGVKCWGYNVNGQVGDGTTEDRWTQVDVNGLTSGVSAIAAGYYHTCALMTGGGVKCWGRNANGQLGDGTTDNHWTPVDVSGLTSGVVAISAGEAHTCALISDGGIKCWGDNLNGQVGNGMSYDRWTPSDVVELRPTYELTITFAHGKVTKNPDQATYHEGDVVQLTAAPNAGWAFANWTDDLTSSVNPDFVTIHGNTSVTANFTQLCYTLTRAHTGSGSDPTALPTNSSGCSSGQYHYGESISLTASPAVGWAVGSWSGTDNDASTSTTNSLSMPSSNRTVTANYIQLCYTLTRAHTGSGSDPTASPTNSSGCSSGQYHAGESISLTASPEAGWAVGSWVGTDNDASTSTTNSLSMPLSNRTVTANYTLNTYALSVSKNGTGSGTVASSPAGITCGATCFASFNYNTSVTLTATAATGSTFAGWSGSGCSGKGTCTVTMSAVRSVTASFTLNTYLLSVSKTGAGSGTVTSSPVGITCGATCSHSFNYNTSVTLTATAATGSTFTGWSGSGCSGTGTCTVILSAARSVTASFTLNTYRIYLPLVIR